MPSPTVTSPLLGRRLTELEGHDEFPARHIGPSRLDQEAMLATLGLASLAELIDQVVPAAIRDGHELALPRGLGEAEALARLRALADRNQVVTSLIGLGYSDTITPTVILRNVLENPAWYTAYTPYQPEISQGRLEALLNFQTMICDLTGMELANASLLDEATAAAEAMAMCHRLNSKAGAVFVVDDDCHPQTLAVVATRARPLGLEVVTRNLDELTATADLPAGTFGVLAQYPGSSGVIRDHAQLIEATHGAGALVTVAADLLGLVLLRPPGEIGADIVVGSSQRFGVPLGFGGPHAGYIATRDAHKRTLPGRLVGVSVDDAGRRAYRLTLQTREQHIRREKATSNICTAQVLLAVMAGLYATYHGPDGLARDRQPGPPPHRHPGCRAQRQRCRGGGRRVLRHHHGARAGSGRGGAGRGPRSWHQPAFRRRRHRRHQPGRDHQPRRGRVVVGRVRRPGVDRRARCHPRRRAREHPAPPGAPVADPDPSRLPPAPLRDGHAALPAPSGRP